VRAPFGLLGEVTVEPLTDFPERFDPGARLWAAGREYRVYSARPHRGGLLVQLANVQSRESAGKLRGLLLEVPEETLAPLEEGQYYRFQIVGLEAFDAGGHSLGRIAEVLETGANDVYVVRNDDGDLLVPAIDSAVREVDVAGGRIVLDPPQGLVRTPHPKPRPKRTPKRRQPQDKRLPNPHSPPTG
jgi:16S rRNA processing protein RimM